MILCLPVANKWGYLLGLKYISSKSIGSANGNLWEFHIALMDGKNSEC